MRLDKLIAAIFVTALLSLFVGVGLLFAQEPTSEPKLSADGSIVGNLVDTSLSSDEIIPTPNRQSSDPNYVISPADVITVTEYDLSVSPTNLIINQAGDVWFSSFEDNAIGKLNVTTKQVSVYSRANDSGNVWAIKRDSTEDIWYATVNAQPNEVVGKFVPATNTFVEWPISGIGQGHFGLELDPNTGDVWVATLGNPGIYKLSPTTNSVTAWSTFPYIRAYDLDIDPDGNIWLTVQPGGNEGVIRLNPTTNEMIVWEMPVADSRPFWVVAVSSNEIWLTEFASVTNSIARLIPSTNTLSEFRIPIPDSFPRGLLKHGNKMRFTAGGANSIGELDLSSVSPTTTTVLSPITLSASPTTTTTIMPNSYVATISTEASIVTTTPVTPNVISVFTMTPLPTGNSMPFGMVLEPSQNNVWFAESAGRIGKITVGSITTVYLPVVLKLEHKISNEP